MPNFDEVYDEMNKEYSAIETLMGEIYSNEGNSEMIMRLGEIAKKMLETQISFVSSFAKENKDILLENLSSKKDALNAALNKGKTI